MLPVPVRAATVAPQTVVVDNTENEELLRDLRNRIDELQRAQENAEQTGQAAQEEALQAVRERMQADLDAVKDIMESAQSELAASERAREADAQRYALELEQLRLSHDLEMRRLEAETARAGSVPGMSEDDLRTQGARGCGARSA